MFSRRHWRIAATVVACAIARGALAQTDTLPIPTDLLKAQPGQPIWKPLERLRATETAYLANKQWRPVYLQVRAMAEAGIGNHAEALRMADLIRPMPKDSTSLYPLSSGARAADAIAMIVAAADTAHVVMINERHHASADRLLTLRLLPILRQRGYRYFAAEALDPADTMLMTRRIPLEHVSGFYTDEPVFGEVIREALRLGYIIVPYEVTKAQDVEGDGHNSQQRRDSVEAQNLFDLTVRRDSSAKVLVHAGYGHVVEKVTNNWYPMAAYFKQLSGVDPVTVDQTWLSEASDRAHEHPARRAAARAGLIGDRDVVLVDSLGRVLATANAGVDFEVVSPKTTYVEGRPRWMTLDGRRTLTRVDVGECAQRTCWIEARIASDPDSSVVLDRVEVTGAGYARLFLPAKQPINIRVLSNDGKLLRAFSIRR